MTAKALKGKGKSARELEEDSITAKRIDQQTRLFVTDSRYKLLTKLVTGAVVLGVAYFVRDSVVAFAGRHTEVNAFVKAVANLSFNEYVAWSISAVSGVAWFKERRLRKKTITELGTYAAELEKKLAPERKSSGLLASGQQKESDKDA